MKINYKVQYLGKTLITNYIIFYQQFVFINHFQINDTFEIG
jgi:hypothetical protein